MQHGRVLTFREPRKQHDLAVGELQRVVMGVWLLATVDGRKELVAGITCKRA